MKNRHPWERGCPMAAGWHGLFKVRFSCPGRSETPGFTIGRAAHGGRAGPRAGMECMLCAADTSADLFGVYLHDSGFNGVQAHHQHTELLFREHGRLFLGPGPCKGTGFKAFV